MAISSLNMYQEYQKMLDSVFGTGVVFVKDKGDRNNVIGAWAYRNEFLNFKQNYKKRLIRLRDSFDRKENIKNIHRLISEIGYNRTWRGTYAELVAYDVLRSKADSEFTTDVTRDSSFALARYMDYDNINYDIHYDDAKDVYMDVKAFTDTVGDLLNNGIIKKVLDMPDFKGKQINVMPQYPLVDVEDKYNAQVPELQNELIENLRKLLGSDCKTYNYKSEILPELSFQMRKGPGMLSTLGEYNPIKRAEKLSDVLLWRYCNKLPFGKPFYLVFVNFAWYNQRESDAFDFNCEVYRHFAELTFSQYEKDETKLIRDIKRGYRGPEAVSYATRKLTGIIFIDDNTITDSSHNIYIYENLKADNKSPEFGQYLQKLVEGTKEGEYVIL
jgi:hypothetical protein